MEKLRALWTAVRAFLNGMWQASGFNEEAWRRQIHQMKKKPPEKGSSEYWRHRPL